MLIGQKIHMSFKPLISNQNVHIQFSQERPISMEYLKNQEF
jgi:hypothetical protein